jgi:uncharacterized protein YgiM (DUF1202 family)
MPRLTFTALLVLAASGAVALAQPASQPTPAKGGHSTPAKGAAPKAKPAPAQPAAEQAKPAAKPAPAAAPFAEYAAVVTRDDAALRSGPAYVHYVVTSLKSGATLKVDGEDSGFLRVHYPAGTKAYVKADEVNIDAGGKTAKLQKPSLLRAANATAGDRGSWYPLLAKELEPGTELTVLDTVKGDDGKPTLYAVVAPAQARGWINRELVRKLSDDEARAMGAAVTPAPTAAVPATATNTGATPAGTSTAGSAPAGSSAPAGTSAPAGEAPKLVPVDAQGTPMTTPPAAEAGASTTPPAAAPVTPVEPPKPTPAQSLSALFRKVQGQPLQTAELDEAIQQFEQHLGSGQEGDRASRQLQSMLDVLKLRRDSREALKRSEQVNGELQKQQDTLRAQIAELEKQAVYRAIGRLEPSTVYDGTRLPKLFRIVSPEPGTARTVGYIAPAQGLDLEGKINRVVGIVGEARMDEVLRANILTPVRVDVLNLNPVASTPSIPGGTVLPTTPQGNQGNPATPASNPPASGG